MIIAHQLARRNCPMVELLRFPVQEPGKFIKKGGFSLERT